MQKFVLRSALRPNQISFSHSQDPTRHEADCNAVGVLPLSVDLIGIHSPCNIFGPVTAAAGAFARSGTLDLGLSRAPPGRSHGARWSK